MTGETLSSQISSDDEYEGRAGYYNLRALRVFS